MNEVSRRTPTWGDAWRCALRSGSAASALSAGMLALCGKLERNSPAGPVNAPSQWVWGEREAYNRRASLRHTLVGYVVHHIASLGWATLHEKHVARLVEGRPLAVRLGAAGLTAAFACFVDYKVARGRLQPGFDKHLGRTSLLLVYAAFAAGLAVRLPARRAANRASSAPRAR